MSIIHEIVCDGNPRQGDDRIECTSRIELNQGYRYAKAFGAERWTHDSVNEFHYCRRCSDKMIESGELERE